MAKVLELWKHQSFQRLFRVDEPGRDPSSNSLGKEGVSVGVGCVRVDGLGKRPVSLRLITA